jgi:FAD/FMN-containing dehydrogenase
VSHAESAVSISNLRAALAGRVITPQDADYDAARTVFLGGIDRHPAVIVRPADASDVARVISVARESGVPLAIRSGGHSGAGHCTTDGGIVLDLHDMKSLEIDATARTAWAQTGLTASEYSTTVGALGLATGFGDTGSVGIGGITLAGGIGYLTRRYGMTIDSVIGAELVNADGELLQVNASSHPDLFWAIRGGGGNFGVVTRFQYRLHPVDQIVGGLLLLPASAESIVKIIAAAEDAPEELSAIVNVMPAPPMPFVPESYHGQLVMMILLCYAGDADAGARALAPFRSVVPAVTDMVKPMRYPEIFPPEDPSYHPKAIGRTMFIDRVDRGTADTIIDYLQRSDASLRVAQLRVLGGAMARVAPDATAFAHRRNRILVNVAAFYDDEHDRPSREAWTQEFVAALNQGPNGSYVAFINHEGEAYLQAAYPESTRHRLADVKARYDPTNFFRLNHNIRPRVVQPRESPGIT